MVYRKAVNGVNPKSSYCKEKIAFFFCFLFLLSTYEMMDANKAYSGNHFTIYVSQTTMLYTFNLHNDIYQICLSETSKKKKINGHVTYIRSFRHKEKFGDRSGFWKGCFLIMTRALTLSLPLNDMVWGCGARFFFPAIVQKQRPPKCMKQHPATGRAREYSSSSKLPAHTSPNCLSYT